MRCAAWAGWIVRCLPPFSRSRAGRRARSCRTKAPRPPPARSSALGCWRRRYKVEYLIRSNVAGSACIRPIRRATGGCRPAPDQGSGMNGSKLSANLVGSVRHLGAAALRTVANAGRSGVFLFLSVLYACTPPWKAGRILRRIQFLGYQSLPVVILTGAFTGMVLALQGFYALNRFGSDAFLGPLVALSLIRELGPVLTALMIIGRGGSAVTAEIGIMRIGEQIDALELMGLNPFRYLVTPTLIASLVVFPLLTAVFDVVGILGGWFVGVKLLGVNVGTYFGEMREYVEWSDITGGFWKAVSFGIVMSWISCYKGWFTGLGAEGVSRATTQAVVAASVLVLVWDYVMTSFLF